MTLSGAITPGQSGVGSDGNDGVLRIPQSYCSTGALSLDCLFSYPGHLSESYSSAEIQSGYSITQPGGTGSNDTEEVHFQELRSSSLTTVYSLVSYPR